MDTHRAIVVEAADYNGKTFDGSPISTLLPLATGETLYDTVPWFYEAIRVSKILIEARGSTDYAWFGVKDEYGNVHWAGPGDAIIRVDGGTMYVVPYPLVKYLERIARDIRVDNPVERSIKVMANAMQLDGLYRPLPRSE